MKLSVLSVLSLFFSEKLFMQMADRIAEDGFKNAGYQYVCIDVSIYLENAHGCFNSIDLL